MVTLTLPADRRPDRRLVFGAYVVVLAAAVVGVLAADADQLRHAAGIPTFWLMTGLALLAAAGAFLTVGPRGNAIVICPTVCFTFAILLCWGLAPAIVAQMLAVAVVGLRLRTPASHVPIVAVEYALSFVAAYAVLYLGDPDPFTRTGTAAKLGDAVTVAGAVVAWLGTYCVMVLLTAWVRSSANWRAALDSFGYQLLFKAALLLIAPVLAVAAHVNAAFVPLIFVPLYAVERMTRLSAERDRAARVDPLTGLANRTGVQSRFRELAAAEGGPALLLLDLDRFKHINDALGHEVGDRLLIEVAERLSRVDTGGGIVGRLGGDEFAIVAAGPRYHDRGDGGARGGRNPLAPIDAAHQLADSVLVALAEPICLDDLRVDITASIGIAVRPLHGDDFATLMRHADVAMYEAKRRGDIASVYESAADHNCPQRLSLLTDFRRALEVRDRDEISLHYQPQVALDTGEVVGAEALLRWQSGTRGLVSTEELLHVAEHTAVMQLLTKHVINDVVAQVADWNRAGIRLRTSLNVSARDLYSGDIVAQLAGRLARHGVPPAQIQLEITESALMADPTRALATIGRISALGVAVALDDFGTGYSSLQHLRKLPLSEIKIDRSFIAGMAHNSDDAAIVRSTVELARALGLRAVAEGVENEYTWQMLAGAGCALAQGWFTARPMPGDAIPSWVDGFRPPCPEPARREGSPTLALPEPTA